MRRTLAEELLLLSLDNETGEQLADSTKIEVVLAGAELVDLLLAERIRLDDGGVGVTDETPLGQEELDTTLREITAGEVGSVQHWVGHLRARARERARQGLLEHDLVRHERRRFLGVFPQHRYIPTGHGVSSDLRDELRDAVMQGRGEGHTKGYEQGHDEGDGEGPEPHPRTVALARLILAAGLAAHVWQETEPAAVEQRLGTPSSYAWLDEQVGKAVREVDAAVSAAITGGAGVAVFNT